MDNGIVTMKLTDLERPDTSSHPSVDHHVRARFGLLCSDPLPPGGGGSERWVTWAKPRDGGHFSHGAIWRKKPLEERGSSSDLTTRVQAHSDNSWRQRCQKELLANAAL